MDFATKDELVQFGRSAFESADSASVLLPALTEFLSQQRFDDVFTVVKCAFINTNYYGAKYNSNIPNASIEERYFDRMVEILTGLGFPEDTYMPLIIAAFNPKTSAEVTAWARPARAFFLRICQKDFYKAAGIVERLCYGQKFALDVLYEASPDLSKEYLLSQLKTCTFYQSKLIREFLTYRAPETLPPKKPKDAGGAIDIEIGTAEELIEICKSRRDPGTVKKIKQGLKLFDSTDLPALCDYLLCDFDASLKKTEYLSSFFARYGSDDVKALLAASINIGEKKKYAGVLSALELDMEDIVDEKVNDMELDLSYRKAFEIDGFTLYVAVTNNLGVVMQDSAGNRFTFTEGRVPQRYKLIKKHIDRYMKTLEGELNIQKERFYNAYRFFRAWRHETFMSNIVKKPLLSAVASEFFWGEYRGEKLISVFYIENGELFDLNKKPYCMGGDTAIALIHPVELEGQFEFLKRLSMTQPFSQLKREVFAMPPAVPNVVTRFHGTVMHSQELIKKIRKYGWRPVKNPDGSICAARKEFPAVSCELSFQSIYSDVDALITIGNAKLTPAVPQKRVYSEIANEIFTIIT